MKTSRTLRTVALGAVASLLALTLAFAAPAPASGQAPNAPIKCTLRTNGLWATSIARSKQVTRFVPYNGPRTFVQYTNVRTRSNAISPSIVIASDGQPANSNPRTVDYDTLAFYLNFNEPFADASRTVQGQVARFVEFVRFDIDDVRNGGIRATVDVPIPDGNGFEVVTGTVRCFD